MNKQERRFAVMVDRDGTMGGNYHMRTPQEYFPFDGTKEAFALFNREKIPVFIVTNQSCIARHLDNGYDFDAEFRGIGADDWFICPHDTLDHCRCRKPEPGLIEQAAKKHGLDLRASYMVGDRWSDMVAGGKMGMKLVLVKTGRGEEALGKDRVQWQAYQPDLIAENLLEAAQWIVKQVNIERKPPSNVRGGKINDKNSAL